jgi:hypothetical protein
VSNQVRNKVLLNPRQTIREGASSHSGSFSTALGPGHLWQFGTDSSLLGQNEREDDPSPFIEASTSYFSKMAETPNDVAT